MKNTIGLAVMLAVAGVQPAFAAPAAGSPAWCKGIGDADVDSGASNALDTKALVAIPGIVGALCKPDRDAREQKAQIEAARITWSKKLDMNDADWADAAAWAVVTQSKRFPGTNLEPADRKLGWAAMNSIDQYIAVQANGSKGIEYLVDAFGPKLSEAGRLAYLLANCVTAKYSGKEVEWAACQGDLDAFDPKKLIAELRADKKYTGYERFNIRLTGLLLLPAAVKKMAPEIKAARAADPAFEKMFQIAAETRTAWAALWKSDAALVDLAFQLDDARVTNKRSALKGCEEKTWPAFQTAVSAVPAERFGNLSLGDRVSEYAGNLLGILGTDPKAYLASIALHMCEADNADALVVELGNAFVRWPGHRGPRTSTLTNIRNAGLELDDRSRTIEYPTIVHDWFKLLGTSGSGIKYGAIAAIKRKDGEVRVEFGKKVEKQFTCLKSTYTKRVQRILPDGTLIYELNCLKWGTVAVDKTPEPQTVKVRYADGLKKGMIVVLSGDTVLAAWTKANTRIPSFVAGVAVK